MHSAAQLHPARPGTCGGDIDPILVRDLRMHVTRRGSFGRAQEADWGVAYLGMVELILRSAGLGDRELGPLRDMADAVSRRAPAPIEQSDF